MKNTLIYSCLGVLAAVPLADALLPDPTPETTAVDGIPGLECPEDPYASSQTWNCEGATIIAADWNLPAAEETVRRIKAQDSRALAVAMDVSQAHQVNAAITEAIIVKPTTREVPM